MDSDSDFDDSIDLEELEKQEQAAIADYDATVVASQKLISAAGENAILRANIEANRRKHQQEIHELLHANQKLRREHMKEVESQKEEIERLNTERQFLQNDIANLYRSKTGQPSRRANGEDSPVSVNTSSTSVNVSSVPTGSKTPRSNLRQSKDGPSQNFEAMFRSGFDVTPLSPKRKKLKTIHRDESLAPRKREKSAGQNSEEDVQMIDEEKVMPIKSSAGRPVDAFRTMILTACLTQTGTRVMELIGDNTDLFDVILFEDKSYNVVVKDFITNAMKSLELSVGGTPNFRPHAISYLDLIQKCAEFQPSVVTEELLDNLLAGILRIMSRNLEAISRYAPPENQPPFRNVMLSKEVVHAVAETLYSLRLMEVLACIEPSYTFERIPQEVLTGLLAPRMPSHIISRALSLICLQPFQDVKIDLFYKYLGETIPEPSVLTLVDLSSPGLSKHKWMSQSSQWDLDYKPDERLSEELQNRTKVDLLVIRDTAIKRLALMIIDGKSARPIAENIALIAAVIHCLSRELNIAYNTPALTSRTPLVPETTKLRTTLLTHCVQLLHGVWNLFPDAPSILANLDPKYGYQFTVALAGIAFSSNNLRFDDQVVDLARDLLEQCTTLSEADDIYLSMNPA